MFQEVVYAKRIARLKKKLEPNTIYVFSNPSHIAYFTGFEFLVPNEREAFLVCDTTTATLIHTNFAPIANFEFLNYASGTHSSLLKMHLEKILQNLTEQQTKNPIQILYDAQTLYVAELEAIQQIKKVKTGTMLQTFVHEFMNKKDPNEISAIKKASQITMIVFEVVQTKLQVGITENAVSQMISNEFSKHMVRELAFPTIVAFGANSAKPHHQPGLEKLKEDTVVLIDMGGKFEKYCADMTRTFWFGANPSKKFKKIEKIVLDAYSLALAVAQQHAKKTILAKDIDNAARVHISNQGFGDYFIHTTGHGLGLDIHEQPSLSWKNSDPINKDLAMTIEPGIYLEKNFGYRYENTVLTTSEGCEVLTKLENE